MAIDAFIPPLQNIIVQLNYLVRRFEEPLMPVLGYDLICEVVPVNSREGESETMSLPSLLPPIVQDSTPIPVGTDLDNGMLPQTYGYEQFAIFIGKMHGMMKLSLEMDETKIAAEYLRNWETLAVQAGQSLDTRAALKLFQAYDSGNTYATAAPTNGGLQVKVDNVYGFDTAYTAALAAGGSPGIPQATTAQNTVPVLLYSSANPNSPPVMATVTGVILDVPNKSTALAGGVFYGQSGTLVFAAAPTYTLVPGDTIRANDGAFTLRPNGKTNRSQLGATDLATLSLFGQARGRLKRRRVPPLPNGMYAAFVDSDVYTQLLNDEAFQRATATSFGTSSFFRGGVIAVAMGLEFVETTTNPIYQLPNLPGYAAHHAMVLGMGAIVKGPFKGSIAAATAAGRMSGAVDVKIAAKNIIMITRGPIDAEADTVTQTWKYTGGHVCRTDVTSNPATIPTSDYSRYKRGVLLEFTGSM